jgi:tetratricopeptide (TPR) repeat protein
MTADVFSLFLNACEAGIRKTPERLLNVSQRLIAAAPNLAVAHAMHARALAVASDSTDDPDEAALMTEQSRASARHALRLDRRTPQAYVALALTYEGGWREIERNLRRAIEIDPEFPFTRNIYAGFLYDIGRTNAAIAQFNRVSRVADPRPRWHLMQLALTHASLSDSREADAAIEHLRSIDPQLAPRVEWEIAIWWKDVAVARSRLRALGQEAGVSERDIRCMDLYLSRLERQPAGARGLPGECVHMQWDWRVRMLARQGDVDGAYALYAEAAPPRARYRTRGFFYPEMRAFRRDARFMPLAERLGLVDYWIATDKWPDFCSEPDLPHDCRTAARAAQAHAFAPVVSTASTTNRAAPRARSATSASRRSSPRRSKRDRRT